MTVIRVSPEDVHAVTHALEAWEEAARLAAAFVGGAGLGTSLLAALTGQGLAVPSLLQGLDRLVVSTIEHSHHLGGDVHQIRGWGVALMGSQVMETSAHEWASTGFKVVDLAHEVGDNEKWIARGSRLALEGQWLSHASHWKVFGHYWSGGVGVTGAVVSLAGSVIPGVTGHIVEEAACFGVAAYGVAAVFTGHYRDVFPSKAVALGGKGAGRLLTPLAVLSIASSVSELAGKDYKELAVGDPAQHSDNTRNYLYSAKMLDTIGSVAVTAAPFTPVAPFVAGVGCVLMGVGAGIKGAVYITDALHEHHVTAHSVEAWGLHQAKHMTALLPHVF